GAGDYGSIDGHRLTRDELSTARREAMLYYFFNSGRWPDAAEAKRMGYDIDRETYFRAFFIRKQEEMGIHVGDEAVAKAAANILRQINRDQPVPVTEFIERYLKPQGLTGVDMESFVRHNLGIE